MFASAPDSRQQHDPIYTGGSRYAIYLKRIYSNARSPTSVELVNKTITIVLLTPLTLISKLATRWYYWHWLQNWPPDSYLYR